MTQTNPSIDFSKFKCRASSVRKILSNSQSNPQITEKQLARLSELEAKPVLTDKQREEMADLLVKKSNKDKVILSDTCIEYLMEVYAWETRRMISVNKEAIDAMQIRKGKEGEKEAITLLSRVDKQLYQQHKERISNDFLTGEIDAYLGKHIYAAHNVTDIKNAFDYPVFLKKINNGLENGQKEQVQTYGDITGAQDLYIANCLISFSPEMIEDMKYRVLRKLNCATTESPEFIEKWADFERSTNFEQIPIQQRVFKIKVEPFSDFERQKVYDRVKVCRDFLCAFHEKYQSLS